MLLIHWADDDDDDDDEDDGLMGWRLLQVSLLIA